MIDAQNFAKSVMALRTCDFWDILPALFFNKINDGLEDHHHVVFPTEKVYLLLER
jgi:hypothetical protein